MNRIRVLVADDAAVVRRLLASVLDEDSEIEVVGFANNGRVALTKIEQLRPDVLVLDIEMPELDGLGTLAELRKRGDKLPVVMFSTLTERGASATMEALTLGASDYVCKPANVGSVTAAMESVRSELIPKIKALCPRPLGQMPGSAGASGVARDMGRPVVARPAVVAPAARAVPPTGVVDVVAIGSSTGGPKALSSVLAGLPADFPVPIVVTQHMPPVFTRLLAERLDSSVALTVREATDGAPLEPGVVLIAPGDHHFGLRSSAAGGTVALNQGPPVHFCRPAVDVMFREVARVFGGRVLAVVLTGMGQDGRDGAAELVGKGATVIAQDQATSVVWGMPGAVASAGLADVVLPVSSIAEAVAQRAARVST